MKQRLIFFVGMLLWVGITVGIAHAEWDTTNGNKFARHNYTVRNDGSCAFNFTVDLEYSTTGDTFFYTENIQRSGHLEAGESQDIGYVEFRTYQCQAGTGTSSIRVTASNSCASTNASTGYTSVFVEHCPSQQKQCNDSNGDGYADQCKINGNLPQTCETLADCPTPPPEKLCHDADGDGVADSCKVDGNLGQSCDTLADCAPPPSNVYYCTSASQCASAENCPSGSACYPSRAGCLANAAQDCGTSQERRCNAQNQCVIGGNGDLCDTNADCQVAERRCNDQNQCVIGGTGIPCSSNQQCRNQQPRCNDQNQCVIGGTGDICTTNADCALPQMRCNDQNQCAVNGTGIACATNQDCVNQPRCNAQNQCVIGGDGDICTTNADCEVPVMRCNAQNQCAVNGTGIACSTNADCANQPRCNDQRQCVIGGTGILCDSNSDCGGGGGTSCNTSCTQEGTACNDNNSNSNNVICLSINGSLTCRNPSCPTRTNCQCGNGGQTSCNTSCSPVGSTCDDGTICTNINGSSLCRNPQCTGRTDCECGGGGLNRCWDSNNDGRYDQCAPQGAGPFCGNVNECNGTGGALACNSDRQCVRGATGASCTTDADCIGGRTVCGDGVIQRPNSDGQYEECDDGNRTDDGNGCTADCRLTRVPPTACQACGCVEKTTDLPIAGDNQSVIYQIVLSNKSQDTGQPFMPYEMKVFDSIFQKKKYIDNNPLKGVDSFVATEGYIEYPTQICITENTGGAVINGSITSGCFSFSPGVNVGDPAVLPGGSAPFFTVRNLTPGNHVTFQYAGKARTTYPDHELAPTTQFVDITNEARTPTNNDYANVTISKPYLITRNSGNILLGTDPTEVANVSNLAPLFGLDPDFYRNIAGLILSPNQVIRNLTSYLAILTQYIGFNSTEIATQLDTTIQGIIKNSTVSRTNLIRGEADLALLGQRPDKARIFVSDGSLTIKLSPGQKVAEQETIIVKNGDLKIESNIEYTAQNKLGQIPSVAFVVLNGDIVISQEVSRLDGVYVVKDNTRSFTGETSPVQLIVNGSLFGNVSELLNQRTFVGLPERDGGSVVVNYDARILSATPPGLKDILGGIIFQQVAK